MTFLAHRLLSTRFRPARSLVLFAALTALLALTVAPASADWQTGVDAFKKGDHASAEAAFRHLTETQPDWYGGHFMLGRVLLARDQTSAALASLERAHQLEARPDVALLLARTALAEDKASVARDALAAEPPAALPAEQRVVWLSLRAKAAGDDASRLRDLEAATKLAPKDLNVRLSAADAALGAQRLDEAVRHLQAAKELSPADEAVLYRLLKVRVAQGEAASESQEAAACVRTAEAAADLAAVTGKASHLSVAGRSYLCGEDLGRAGSYFAQAVEAEPNATYARELANVQFRQEQWEDAMATLRPYLETEGEERARIHQIMGRALEGKQRFLEAIPHYEIAGDAEGIAHAREGQAALDHNKEQQAIADKLKDLEDKIGELEDEESGLR